MELRVTGTLRHGLNHAARLARVAVSRWPLVAPAPLPDQGLIAKFYDPLFWEFHPRVDPFQRTNKSFTQEVWAYQHLADLFGTIVPRYYGPFDAVVPLWDSDETRIVPMILPEAVSGSDLLRLEPGDYSIYQR